MIETENESARGSEQVRSFYDTQGWKTGESGDRTLDLELFGNWEIGKIRQRAHSVRLGRIREAYASLNDMNLVECGCGGNPAMFLTDLCASYTGVDFSTTGLESTARKLADTMGNRARVVAADLCSLPFKEGQFDAAYSAHALYHIPSAEAQGRAFDEILRVVRPGGVVVFVLANPRPLLFPGRLSKRLVADTPVLGKIVDRLRKPPPLPFNPMTLSWMRRRIGNLASVEIITYAMASIWFDHHVLEKNSLGRTMWNSVAWLERRHPRISARLGNFVTIKAVRT